MFQNKHGETLTVWTAGAVAPSDSRVKRFLNRRKPADKAKH
jgi:hypothetical protein